MKYFLVVERPERLEAPGGEFEILHGAVMSEKGLEAWAPRNLETTPGAAFLALVDTAKANGFALFALPTKGEPADAPGLVVEEVAVNESRTVLVRHAPDWTGTARIRWQEADCVHEVETPGWFADYLCSMSKEIHHLRGEFKAKSVELEAASNSLASVTAECARLKAGMPVPASARGGRGKKGSPGPANASAPPVAGDGAKSVADVQAELAATLEKEAAQPAKGKKYRGSAGDD